jgi:2-(1,2-epoxy-1,2-dihydrophenyl)acetyl-CoA isomerase
MSDQELVVERLPGGVALVSFNRPERMNAISWTLLTTFRQTIKDLDADADVRALVLTGRGRAFCAGTDLQQLADDNPSANRDPQEVANDHPWNLVGFGKPTVAAMNGVAVGLGIELATQCDVRIGSTAARAAWAFPLRGLVPDTGAGTYLLPRIVGLSTALQWTMSGRMVGAEELLATRFVDALYEPDALVDQAVELARSMCKGAPLSIRETKRLMYQGLGRDDRTHTLDNTAVLNRMFQTEDHHEGVQSFLEKREPVFKGR